MSDNDLLYMFEGKEKPDHLVGWKFYQQGLDFNTRINLYDMVKVNENFFVGKQWEGVETNGLPTPQINILKRVRVHLHLLGRRCGDRPGRQRPHQDGSCGEHPSHVR